MEARSECGGNLVRLGETRYSSGAMPTDRLYTGQVEEAELGLYYYVARMFDPALGRFLARTA